MLVDLLFDEIARWAQRLVCYLSTINRYLFTIEYKSPVNQACVEHRLTTATTDGFELLK
jgi:hypothetical protein